MPLYGTIFVIKRSGEDGSQYPLTARRCVFGSADDCDIRICLPAIAPHHCELEVTENKDVFLTNLDSNEPTILNGQEVPVGKAIKLKQGDVLTVTDRSFRFDSPRTIRRGSAVVNGDLAITSKLAVAAGKTTPIKSQIQNGSIHDKASTGVKDRTKTPQHKAPTPRFWTSDRKDRLPKTPKLGRVSKLFQETRVQPSPKFTGVPKISKFAGISKVQERKTPTTAKSPARSVAFKILESTGTPTLTPTGRNAKEQQEVTISSPAVGNTSKLFRGTDRALPKPLSITKTIRKSQATPKLTEISKLFESRKSVRTPKVGSIRRLMKEHEQEVTSSPDLRDISKLFEEADKIRASPQSTAESREKSSGSPTLVGISALFKKRQSVKTPRVAGIRRLMKEPSQDVFLPDIDGVSDLFKGTIPAQPTPKFAGLSHMFREEKPKDSPELSGVPTLFSSRVSMASTKLAGVRRPMTMEPEEADQSLGFVGLPKLFQEDRIQPSPKLAGMSLMFREETHQGSPKLAGLSTLFTGRKSNPSPQLQGVRQLMKSPPQVVDNSPDLDGISKLFEEVPVRRTAKKKQTPVVVEENIGPAPATRTGRILRNRRAVPNTPDIQAQSEVSENVAKKKETPATEKSIDPTPGKGRTLRNRRAIDTAPDIQAHELEVRKPAGRPRKIAVDENVNAVPVAGRVLRNRRVNEESDSSVKTKKRPQSKQVDANDQVDVSNSQPKEGKNKPKAVKKTKAGGRSDVQAIETEQRYSLRSRKQPDQSDAPAPKSRKII